MMNYNRFLEGIKMKKIVMISILAVFMLVLISYATAVNIRDVERKESPLYRIRAVTAIGEKVDRIVDNIKTKFLGERIFFLQFPWLKNEQGEKIWTTIQETICVPMTCGGQKWYCFLTIEKYQGEECSK
jgi:hypothetical protein